MINHVFISFSAVQIYDLSYIHEFVLFQSVRPVNEVYLYIFVCRLKINLKKLSVCCKVVSFRGQVKLDPRHKNEVEWKMTILSNVLLINCTNLFRYIKYSKFEIAPFCHLNVMFSCLVSSNSTSAKTKILMCL